MAHIQSGESFASTSPDNAFTVERANNMVNGAEILVGSISERSIVVPATGDYIALNDVSANIIGRATLDTLVRTIATTDAIAATASLRTLGTTSTSAAAGNDSRFPVPVTGVVKSAGTGSTFTAAVPPDYALAPTIITLTAGVGAGNCALNTKFTVAFPSITTACTVTLNSIPDGATLVLKFTQGASSASTLTLVCNSGSGSGALTQTRLSGSGAVTGSTNAVDKITIERFGAGVFVTYQPYS